MSRAIAVVQSSYIPWKGYFDLINLVDEFILFDDVQYTRRDWRNRNQIKTPHGLHWLTIPVETKGKYLQKIKDTVVNDRRWALTHWRTIVHNYAKSRRSGDHLDALEALYRGCTESSLSRINHRFLTGICALLGISTTISWSMDYRLLDDRNLRLVDLCKQARADVYWSGPTARAYLDEGAFEREGIAVRYMDYSGYPEYEQPHPPFEHHVSIVDLLLSAGRDAPLYMKTLPLATSA